MDQTDADLDISHWEYRLIQGADCIYRFGIYEVYFDSNGAVRFWSEPTPALSRETIEEIRNEHSRMAAALTKPALKVTKGPKGDTLELR